MDRKASSRSSIVVRHPTGDKLIVGKSKDGTYHYFNAKGNDSGTIIDLVQAMDGGTLGDVRKKLRHYQPNAINETVPQTGFFSLAARDTDLSRVRVTWGRGSLLTARNDYLSDCRKIHPDVYLNPRFKGRFRIDHRGNVLAAHHNEQGLCGFEIKNGTSQRTTFTGFSPGGVKGLLSSRPGTNDRIMVVCETFIDMLSVAAVTGGYGRRFFSLGGRPSPAQIQLLRSAAHQMPKGSTIELRVDNDKGGSEIAALITAEICTDVPGIRDIVYLPPPDQGTDWNDYLKQMGVPAMT